MWLISICRSFTHRFQPHPLGYFLEGLEDAGDLCLVPFPAGYPLLGLHPLVPDHPLPLAGGGYALLGEDFGHLLLRQPVPQEGVQLMAQSVGNAEGTVMVPFALEC